MLRLALSRLALEVIVWLASVLRLGPVNTHSTHAIQYKYQLPVIHYCMYVSHKDNLADLLTAPPPTARQPSAPLKFKSVVVWITGCQFWR